MIYKKKGRVKKRKKHKPSILHIKDGTCYLCMKLEQNYSIHKTLQEHHIFGGANRSISEAEGMKVHLCLEHHTVGGAAVHNNQKHMRMLQEDGQRAYEKEHSRQQFMAHFGRNYLDTEE